MILFTLIAFAANSVLNRGALVDGSTGPMAYSVVRLLSGALVLWVLVAVQNGFWRPRLHPVSAIALTTYIISFSIAYVTLDAGLGALILFGVAHRCGLCWDNDLWSHGLGRIQLHR